jgi:hypothetical protein
MFGHGINWEDWKAVILNGEGSPTETPSVDFVLGAAVSPFVRSETVARRLREDRDIRSMTGAYVS